MDRVFRTHISQAARYVIFDKLKWTADAAKQWLTDQGFQDYSS